jgi:hypothetical protein
VVVVEGPIDHRGRDRLNWVTSTSQLARRESHELRITPVAEHSCGSSITDGHPCPALVASHAHSATLVCEAARIGTLTRSLSERPRATAACNSHRRVKRQRTRLTGIPPTAGSCSAGASTSCLSDPGWTWPSGEVPGCATCAPAAGIASGEWT